MQLCVWIRLFCPLDWFVTSRPLRFSGLTYLRLQLYEIAVGLEYLHGQDVVHGNLRSVSGSSVIDSECNQRNTSPTS